MNRIGLLTFHDTTNFGALLQTFGLYRKLNDLGYDCKILNYQCANIIKREIPAKFQFSLNFKALAKEILVKSKYRRRYAEMHAFSERYMPKVTQPYNRSSVFNVKEQFDTYLLGSDMLWGLDVTGEDYTYFLDFVPEQISRCSFGTSIGKEWTEKQLLKIKPLVCKFKYISVREDYTSEKLKALLDHDCDVVCDPTMLLTSEEWKEFVSSRYKNKKYVLVYFESEGNKNLQDAREYAAREDLKVYYICAGFSHISGVKKIFPTTVEDFLSLFYYAEAVFTASFHGMLFSLYFNKKLVYYNRRPAYRMITTAKKLEVEHLEGTCLDIRTGFPSIDYLKVNAKIASYRTLSIKKLEAALNKNI